jgi:hypothetical protein
MNDSWSNCNYNVSICLTSHTIHRNTILTEFFACGRSSTRRLHSFRFSDSIETPANSCVKSWSDPYSYVHDFSLQMSGTDHHPTLSNCWRHNPQKYAHSQKAQNATTTMEHLKALLLTSSQDKPLSTERSQHLHATLTSVARVVKSNFVDTLSRMATKRASSPSPGSSTPAPPPKRRRSLAMPETPLMPTSSMISSLTQSIGGAGTNQAIQDVL